MILACGNVFCPLLRGRTRLYPTADPACISSAAAMSCNKQNECVRNRYVCMNCNECNILAQVYKTTCLSKTQIILPSVACISIVATMNCKQKMNVCELVVD